MSTKSDLTVPDAEGLYTKAAKAELSKDWDNSFKLYIKAAESYLHLSRTITDDRLRATCRRQAGKALERAERIKAVQRNLPPVTVDHFSEREQQYVLHKSSYINGMTFPIMDNSSIDESNTQSYVGQPGLSPEQRTKSAMWRPCAADYEIYLPQSPLRPEDIVQHIVSDCSVAASISICIAHNVRFNSKILLSSLYPQDSNSCPCPSENNHYYMKVHVNGSHRRIDMDDQVPTYPDGALMCLSTVSNRQLWPSLVEKAYMKLMGGYDFPGSNSAVDLHSLIGWIPEHIEIKSPRFERERTWSRIVQSFQNGSCILTLGTGETPIMPHWVSLNLLPTHCYAVLDVRDDAGDRKMTVLDSWLQVDETGNPLIDGAMRPLSIQTQEARSRTLDVPWNAVCDFFDGIYLSWDPRMFKYNLAFHGVWKSQNSLDNHASHFPLQLQLEIESKDCQEHDVWILLSRHLIDTRRNTEFIALHTDDEAGNQSDIMSGLNRFSIKGTYTNSTHVLARTKVSYPSASLSIVASYEGEHSNVGFSVSVFSTVTVSWSQTITKPLYSKTIDDAFTSKTSGGNHTYPTFMINPQYLLRIHPENINTIGGSRGSKAHSTIVVRGDRNTSFNITVVWSQGDRITEVGHNDIAFGSGTYSYGFAHASQSLPAGDYNVIVSAFEPGIQGAFSLRVDSSHRFDLTPIPQEGAGMFTKSIRGLWNTETAVGSPHYKQYSSNPIFTLTIPSQTKLKIRLQLIHPSPTTAINVTLFNATTQQTLGSQVATSGPYSDAIAGAVTQLVTLPPGDYWIVPSTYSPGVLMTFRMIIYSSSSGVIVAPLQKPTQ